MIHVLCAIIYIDSKILVAQRSEKMKLPLKWEFPGGKLEENESEIDCIKREIKEAVKNHPKAFPPILPTAFISPNFAIPTTRVVKTNGEIII